MKKFLVLFAVAALLTAPAFAQLGPVAGATGGWQPQVKMINAVGSTTTGYYPAAAGSTAAKNATSVLIQIVSASTSTATISFEQSLGGTFWTTSFTTTNPTSVGELWACPATPYARVNLSAHSAGTISAFMSWRTMAADPVGTQCKQLASSATSFSFTTPALGAATGTSLVLTGNASANHFIGVGTAPTVTGAGSTCGTSAAAITGKDTGGTVTVGSVGGTVCVVTFGTAFPVGSSCTATAQTATNVKATSTTTTATFTATFTAGETFNYVCSGY